MDCDQYPLSPMYLDSEMFVMNLALIIVWILNVMQVDTFTFFVPIKFDESGDMYVAMGNVNISLTSDFLLTIYDNDCTKTLSLKPPDEGEKFAQSGYRPGSSLCKSWFLPKQHNRPRRRNNWWFDLN
ncbi:hypothetical protein MN116_004942 [Schistosoma mekongi]|uniref:Uncharacterized protein n=1 Tax=Schistosoma mekongi TaxID=38744 RepID=A0AAE2D540_SCHME|nr:hypothetical protein MN116_004942 [Schistosoma mekongi]